MLRRCLAELIGTFLVVFMAAGAVVADVYLTHTRLADSFGPFGIIIAYGVAVAVAMMIAMPVSGGHLNPAISISAYISRRINGADAAGYIASQLAGAVIAGFLLRGLTPKSSFQFASGGVPGLGQGVSVLRGAGIEVAITFFVVLVFWAVAIDRPGPRALAPLAVGLAIGLGGFAGSAFTGAAMNPARWFGSAVAATHFTDWLVWVAGPLLGALLGSLAYEAIFMAAPTVSPGEGDEEEEDEDDEDEESGAGLLAATAPPVWAGPTSPPAPKPASPPAAQPASPPAPKRAAPPVPPITPAEPPVPAPEPAEDTSSD
ncbi:MAG TPA: aquaporin [Actinomycetota bacterium]|nr:aquaporin [Actinomycetota bacterium]